MSYNNSQKYVNKKCYLRFIGISQILADELIHCCAHLKNVKGKKRESSNLVVGIFLEEGKSFQALVEFIKKNRGSIKKAQYHFCISVSTNSDSEVIDIPKDVLKLYKKIGGDILFSFTVI